MPGIENLHFDVLLDHQKFDQEIAKVKQLAKDFNTEVSNALDLKKKISDADTRLLINEEKLKKAAADRALSEQKVQTEKAKTAVQEQKLATEAEKTRRSVEGTATATKAVNTNLINTRSIMSTITQLTGVYFGAMGVRRFLSSLIDITGQFEVQRMALRNMLQDLDAADKIYEDLYRFSSESTYRFSELAKYAKQLAAFDINKNNLLETTKMLGDVASGVGVSMDRIILAYGHVKSSGFLRGIQLRSFAQNGVPVLEELSKILTETLNKTISLGDVFDLMMKRQIPFEMVEQAFKNMTSEGGKFYQMQEVLAKTLAGQINILKGRWENLLAAMGEANSGALKGIVSTLSDVISSTEKFGEAIRTAIIVCGTYEATMIAVALATGTLSAATTGLTGIFGRLIGVIAKNPWAILAAALAGVVGLIATARKEITDSQKILEAYNKTAREFDSAIAAESKELDILIGRMKAARDGTEEYNNAKLALNSRFGVYIDQLRQEGVAVDNLASLYDGLSKKIAKATKEKYLAMAQEDVVKAFNDAKDSVESSVKTIIADLSRDMGRELTGDEEGALRHYIETGEKNAIYQALREELEKERTRTTTFTTGYGSTLSQTVKDLSYAEKLHDLYLKNYLAGERYSEAMLLAAQKYDVTMDAIVANTGQENEKLKGWRDNITAITNKLDDTTLKETGLTPKEDEDYYEYLERVGKKYKELREEEDKALKENKSMYKAWIKAIKDVDKALEGNILKDARYNKEPWNGGGDKDTQKINNLKTQVSLWEKYLSIYKRLEPKYGEKTPEEMAEKLGGSPDRYRDIEGAIEGICDELRKLGTEGAMAAYQIEASLGLGWVKELEKQEKEAEKADKALLKYLDTLEKWANATQEISGTGASYGVSKAIADYKKAIANNNSKFWDMAAGGTGVNGGFQASVYLWAQNRANALVTLRQNVSKAVDDIFKEQMQKQGFDLTNLDDKSLTQLLDIKRAIETMKVPDDIKAMLEAMGPQGQTVLSELEQAFKEFAENYTGKTINPELLKKVSKFAKYASGQVKELASAFGRLGEAVDDANLSDAANSISTLGDFASDVASGYSQAGVAGAVIGALVSMAKIIINDVAEGAERTAEATERAKNAALAYSKAVDKAAVDSHSTIFGTNDVGKFKEYVRLAEKYRTTLEGIRDIANEQFPGLLEALGYTDASGNIDLEKVKADLEAGVLTGEGLLDMINNLEEAQKEIDSVMESLFGDIASDAADQIIEGWIEAGDAALDYADILDEVARSYAKMLIQSIIMESFLDPITDQLKESFMAGRYDEAMAMIAGAMDNVADSAPLFEQILSAFDPYFNYDNTGDGSNSLGNGIKGITEDTANLLASYLNAIRQDVSVIRGLQEKGFASVDVIGQALPTLNDYLAQIAATNFDIAQSNQRILGEIQSVIGAEGSSGAIVRVQAI